MNQSAVTSEVRAGGMDHLHSYWNTHFRFSMCVWERGRGMTETHTLRCPTFQQHGDVRTIMQQWVRVVQRHGANEWEWMDRQEEATLMCSTTTHQLITLLTYLIKNMSNTFLILLLNYCTYSDHKPSYFVNKNNFHQYVHTKCTVETLKIVVLN